MRVYERGAGGGLSALMERGWWEGGENRGVPCVGGVLRVRRPALHTDGLLRSREANPELCTLMRAGVLGSANEPHSESADHFTLDWR